MKISRTHSAQRTLGMDPGTKNYAIVGLDAAGHVELALLLTRTIASLKMEHRAARRAFRFDLELLIKRFKPTQVIYEQFVMRTFGTTLVQMVNMMNGAIGVYADKYKFREETITSTTWKNAINKLCELDALYTYATKIIVEPAQGRRKARGIPPHFVDALCMALWLRNGYRFPRNIKKLARQGIVEIGEKLRAQVPR